MATLGLKGKVITGYKGSSKSILAIEQGESQMANYNWLAWGSKVPHWFTGDKPFARAVLQLGYFKDPELPDVPMLKDQVDPKYKPLVGFVGALGLIGRGLAAPPGTPKGAISVMTAAWDKMVKDTAFLAEAEKRKLRVIAVDGATVQKAVDDAINNANPDTLAMAGKMIYGKK